MDPPSADLRPWTNKIGGRNTGRDAWTGHVFSSRRVLALTPALSHPNRTGEGERAATQMRNNTDQKGGRFCHLISEDSCYHGKRLAGGDRIPAGNEVWIPAGDGNPFSLRERRIPGKPSCPFTLHPLPPGTREKKWDGTGHEPWDGTGCFKEPRTAVSGSSPAWDGIGITGPGLERWDGTEGAPLTLHPLPPGAREKRSNLPHPAVRPGTGHGTMGRDRNDRTGLGCGTTSGTRTCPNLMRAAETTYDDESVGRDTCTIKGPNTKPGGC